MDHRAFARPRLTSTSFVLAPLLLLSLGACGGKTTLSGTEGDAGTGADSGIGTNDSGITTVAVDGQACVDIAVTSADLACATDDDCSYGSTGEVCDACDCGGAPVNNAAAARIAQETSSLASGDICGPCGAPLPVKCVAAQCTTCSGGPGQPAGCASDAGVTTSFDAGPDSGVFIGDGGAVCVDVNLADYTTTCSQDSDCILIPTGTICTGDCECGGEPVSATEQSKYDQATQEIMFGLCECPAFPLPQCVGNVCLVCAGPNPSPQCPTHP
jgi:hypothetical protein